VSKLEREGRGAGVEREERVVAACRIK